MRLTFLPTALLALANVVRSDVVGKRNLLQNLQDKAIEALKEAESNGAIGNRSECLISNAAVRQDWNVMSAGERKAYINAVKCIISSPSKSDPADIPGAKTRYDDFVGQHINQTMSIHQTGNFLSWHRYFIYSYEKALREECGYDGYQPYWNWFTYQENLKESPIFDGSDTSMGGDGYFVQHNGSAGGRGQIVLPSGEGGGCIKSGPFKDLQINLGPVSPPMDGLVKVPSPLVYNPRCAKRDLTTFASSTWLKLDNLHNLTLGTASRNIATFQNELQGRFSEGFLGMHSAGHFSIGGDAGDVYSSPNDPVFFMHHAMLDQVWWIWQALYPNEAKTVAGTLTLSNNPPSRNATVDDMVETNWLGVKPRKIKELFSTLGEDPFCYVYA